MHNFVQVIVQPYGITCSYNAELGKLRREYKDASSLLEYFFHMRASNQLIFIKSIHMMDINQILLGILEYFFASNSNSFPHY